MFERMETANQVYEGETPYKTTKRAYSECVSHGRNKREENLPHQPILKRDALASAIKIMQTVRAIKKW